MFTGTCTCGSTEFINNMTSYECLECGKEYDLDDEETDEFGEEDEFFFDEPVIPKEEPLPKYLQKYC